MVKWGDEMGEKYLKREISRRRRQMAVRQNWLEKTFKSIVIKIIQLITKGESHPSRPKQCAIKRTGPVVLRHLPYEPHQCPINKEEELKWYELLTGIVGVLIMAGSLVPFWDAVKALSTNGVGFNIYLAQAILVFATGVLITALAFPERRHRLVVFYHRLGGLPD